MKTSGVKKKKYRDPGPLSTAIEIDNEACEIWKELLNHDLKNIGSKSNYVALSYNKTNDGIIVAGEDYGGAKECIEDLGADEDGYFILVRGSRISKKRKLIRPLTLVVFWIPKNFKLRNLSKAMTKALMSFHLDYILEKLGIANFVFIESSEVNQIEDKAIVKKVDEISRRINPSDETRYMYNFTKTVQQVRKQLSDYKFNNQPLPIPQHHMERVLCSSFLHKEGGGKLSYSLKRRYHVLTADLVMSYYDKKVGGKKKGDYSVVASGIGKGHPEVWKKKKGISGLFGKSKKGSEDGGVNKDGWFFISTKTRTYCCNAENEGVIIMWLRVLEMAGCVREDHEKGKDYRTVGGRKARSIIDFSGEIAASVRKKQAEKKKEEEKIKNIEFNEDKKVIRELKELCVKQDTRIYDLEVKVVDLARDNKRLRDESKQLKNLCGIIVNEDEGRIEDYEYMEIEQNFQNYMDDRNGVPLSERKTIFEQAEEKGGEESFSEESESSQDEDEEDSMDDSDEDGGESKDEEDVVTEEVKKVEKKKKIEEDEEESSDESSQSEEESDS